MSMLSAPYFLHWVAQGNSEICDQRTWSFARKADAGVISVKHWVVSFFGESWNFKISFCTRFFTRAPFNSDKDYTGENLRDDEDA